MIHQFTTYGVIKKVTVSEPKDPKKNASAIILLRYGQTREATNSGVEFVNAVMIRIPGYRYPQVKDKLKEGALVQIMGHLQGVYKTSMSEGYFTTELVADHLEWEPLVFDQEV